MMKKKEKMACMFSSWYNTFRDITTESRIIDLPLDVLDYLMSDGTLVLPSDSSPHINHDKLTSEIETCGVDGNWEDADEAAAAEPQFRDFSLVVQRCISELGGAVLPKLNWSAPRDARWMSFDGTLRCSNFNEILLLLKSSQFITHDLTQPFEGCDPDEDDSEINQHLSVQLYSTSIRDGYNVDKKLDLTSRSDSTLESTLRLISTSDNTLESAEQQAQEVDCSLPVCSESSSPLIYQLVLRRWEFIPESEEFRCFVANNKLIAVSQRNDSLCFPQLPSAMPEISHKIKRFFSHKVQPRFPLSNYVFDVWCRSCDDILIIDFNPFHVVTDSLLFTWEELERMAANRKTVEQSSLPSVLRTESIISDEPDSKQGRLRSDLDCSTDMPQRQVEVRCVETGSVGVSTCPMTRYAMPVDLLDLTTGSDVNKFIDLMRLDASAIQTGRDDDDDLD